MAAKDGESPSRTVAANVNKTVIDYKKSDMGSDYYDQTNTAREAFKTAFDWVDGGNKKKKH